MRIINGKRTSVNYRRERKIHKYIYERNIYIIHKRNISMNLKNLSDKIIVIPDVMYLKQMDLDKIRFGKEGVPIINLEDVKEFIRRLKENIWKHDKKFIGIKEKTCLPLDYIEDEIDKLAGSKLT